MDQATLETRRDGEAGFTLVEALIAVFILIVGIAAVSTLMVVSGTSNQAANHGTAVTAAATRQMELLKAAPFPTLVAGGNLAPAGQTQVPCVAVGTFSCQMIMQGVGPINLRWVISPPLAGGGTPTVFIQVLAESASPALAMRSRAVFSTFRAL